MLLGGFFLTPLGLIFVPIWTGTLCLVENDDLSN